MIIRIILIIVLLILPKYSYSLINDVYGIFGDATVPVSRLVIGVGDALGTEAYIVTSPYGTVWTQQTNPINLALLDIIWAGNQFVAVGDSSVTESYIITSDDGVLWTSQSSAARINLSGITYSSALSLYVAVGTRVTAAFQTILTSPDGVTWTQQVPSAIYQMQGVTWSPILSLFVAVGSIATSHIIMTSANGVNWATAVSPFSANFALNDVTWDPGSSKFIAVGQGAGIPVSAAFILYSTNGAGWINAIPTVQKIVSLRAVVSNGSIIVAVGDADGVDAYIVTSTDGITWTERANPNNIRLEDVTWDSVNGQFVAVGLSDGAGEYIITSPDGIIWTRQTSLGIDDLRGVTAK